MSDEIRFSVAMCTYNGEKYLREQLESIADQTILPAELVVCDDGSTDGTVEILQDFTRSAPFPVRLFQNEANLGVARNFFKAIKLCQMEWVMLCDQDDVWMKDRIERFSKVCHQIPNAHVILSNGLLVNCDLQMTGMTLFQTFRLSGHERDLINSGKGGQVLLRHPFATGSGMVVFRDWVSKLPLPEFDFLHDEWLAWFASSSMRVISSPTFLYRQHENQVTGVDGSLVGQIKRLSANQGKSIIHIEQAKKRFFALKSCMDQYATDSQKYEKSNLDAKIKFIDQRLHLSHQCVSRLFEIFFKLGLKSYRTYSSGWRTVIKDLLLLNRL